MLRFISIDDFALIDHLEVEFGPGLNLITGETGSGKSILVDAVGLLVGGRASTDLIRQGSELARTEGVFSLKNHPGVRESLQQIGADDDSGELIVRREVSRSGQNKVFLNGRLSTQSFLAGVGEQLADIHGQHEQQRLLHPATHLDFLDAFGENGAARQHVAGLYDQYRKLADEFKNLTAHEQARLQRLDLLEYQLAEIEKLQLKPGIDQELEKERSLLASAERRLSHAQSIYQRLYEDEGALLSQLDQITQQLEELASLDATFGGQAETIRAARYPLEELAYVLRDYSDGVEFNPARLEAIQERLAEIQKVGRKYGTSVSQVLEYYESISEEVLQLKRQADRGQSLEAEVDRLEDQYQQAAQKLSEKRHKDASRLCSAVERELADLGMEATVFRVRFDLLEQGKGSRTGVDSVEFLISPNPGEDPRPLGKTASGGELSRVMLALKSVLTEEEPSRLLVFDEVDAGIGGRIAGQLAEKLAAIARRHQVFCVTHLPQIAAQDARHFHVGKNSQKGRTLVRIHRLSPRERIDELSRMLAGDKITDATRKHAREMLGSSASG